AAAARARLRRARLSAVGVSACSLRAHSAADANSPARSAASTFAGVGVGGAAGAVFRAKAGAPGVGVRGFCTISETARGTTQDVAHDRPPAPPAPPVPAADP